MLTNKDRAMLRAIASKEKSLFRIGKNGLTENVIDQINKCLEKRELLKISILQNLNESEIEIAENLALKLNAEVVETKGSTLVLFRKTSINKKEVKK